MPRTIAILYKENEKYFSLYGYVIIDVPGEGSVLETELDFGYVAFELDCEE